MAGRMVTQKTLFLDEKDYNTFEDFISLIEDLTSNLNDKDINELNDAFEEFIAKVFILIEEEKEEE